MDFQFSVIQRKCSDDYLIYQRVGAKSSGRFFSTANDAFGSIAIIASRAIVRDGSVVLT